PCALARTPSSARHCGAGGGEQMRRADTAHGHRHPAAHSTELPHYGHADRRRAAGPRRYADPRPYRRQVPRRQSGLVRPMRLRASRGFTLPELLIVVTVLAVMIAIGVPSFAEFIRNQRVKTASFE